MTTKRHWFERGIAAWEAAFGWTPPGYFCPLCSRAFTDPDDLSREHAPPKNVGGSVVVLTCRGCNSTAGYSLDAAIRRHEDFREFHAGEHKRLRRGRMRIGDVEANALVSVSGDGIKIGPPAPVDPDRR